MYYYFAADAQIWFMSIYDKDEAADLTAAERRALKTAIEEERRQRMRQRRGRVHE